MWSRRAPVTGLIAVVLFVLAGVIAGETPDSSATSEEVTAFYVDDEGAQFAGAILVAYGSLFLLFFAGALRGVLRRAEGEDGGLSAVAFAGGVILALGALIFGGLTFTLADAADELEPAAAQAINALNVDLFFPVAVGTAALLIASGVSALRSGALPRWLAWAAIVVGLVAVTPLGFFAFLAGLLWIAVTSIVLLRAAPPAGTPPAPPARR